MDIQTIIFADVKIGFISKVKKLELLMWLFKWYLQILDMKSKIFLNLLLF